METHDFFLQFMLILLCARFFGEIATRLKMPSVVGELLAGIVLGPSVFGVIALNEVLRSVAEIGILLLLFKVGLETDVRQLLRTGPRASIVAVSGFVFPFVFGFGLSHYLFDFGLLPSMFVGGTLTATSIGVTVRVLSDLGHQNSQEGRLVLGAAVLDDIFGVILLAALYEFARSGEISAVNLGKVVLFILAFLAFATPVAKVMSLVVHRFHVISALPGFLPSMVVVLVMFFAWLSHLIGAPEILGGFAAGLALSRRFFLPLGLAIRTRPGFARRIDDQMSPIVYLFTPVFFVSVGASIDLRAIDWEDSLIWQLSTGLLVVAVAGKMLAPFLIKATWVYRLVVGTAMTPRGEVGLIFTELGRVSGILPTDLHGSLVLVIVVTTVLPPFVLTGLYTWFLPPPDPSSSILRRYKIRRKRKGSSDW